MNSIQRLPVRFGNPLKLVLLLDSITVRRALGSVHELISQALSHGLGVPESGVPSTGTDEPDGLVDPPERSDVTSLPSDGTGSADPGGVFPGAAVHDGGDQDLDGVLAGEQVDDLEVVFDDPHGQHLLTVVTAVHHEGVDQPLDDRALSLPEP